MQIPIEQILQRVIGEVWMIRQTDYIALLKRIECEYDNRTNHAETEKGYTPPWEREDAYPKPRIVDRVSIVPVSGIILKRVPNIIKWYFGATDVEEMDSWIRDAVNDKKVDAIVLDVNSPGGIILGVPELADTVKWARSQKAIVAYTDMLMASAAYWISAGAHAVYSSRSAIVGSIGVYMAIYDYSEWLKKWGVSVDLFKVGKYKAAGLVGTSLTEEQKENFQQSVERSAKQFKGFVTSQRDVSAEAMEGQTFPGDEAVAENLVDSITTLEGAVRDALALASMLNTQGKED